jgi:hypothetical protein
VREANPDDHSSRPWLAPRLQQPTRGLLSSTARLLNAGSSACEGAPQTFVCFARRAGPALPSYLALHHAGFSVPRLLPDERWALTPPFHPYQLKALLKDDEQVSLPPVTAATFRGGLFSVALSVSRSTRTSALPLPWRYQARCPFASSSRSKHFSADAERCPDFPPAPIPQGQRSSSPPAKSIISRHEAEFRTCCAYERVLQCAHESP